MSRSGASEAKPDRGTRIRLVEDSARQDRRLLALPSAAPTFTCRQDPILLSLLFTHTEPTPLLRSTFLLVDMGDHHGPTHCGALFASTLQAYTKSTGISLAEHPLTSQLQSCHSIESITVLLQDQLRTSSGFRENDRLERSIKRAISILSTLSAAAPLDWAIGLVR